MTDESRSPIALRISRPYANEAEFFQRELDCIGRSGIVLLGAPQRPEGVVLRFEVALANGEVLMRGEGRVVGYKARALGHEPGLALRFTRLDPSSKGVLDRALELRESKSPGRTSAIPPALAVDSQGDRSTDLGIGSPSEGPLTAATLASAAITPPPPTDVPRKASATRPRSTPPPLPSRARSSQPPKKTPIPASSPAPSGGSVPPSIQKVYEALANPPASTAIPMDETGWASVAPSALPQERRDELLHRLRARSQALTPARIENLARRRR